MLFFPGGHCSAASDCGWSLYTSAGHGVLAFSRPGYGNTDVGRLNAAEFVPAVAECCEDLGIGQTAGAVGVSFGGMQALHAAWSLPELVPRLVLHSCAASTRAYPDGRLESLVGPLVLRKRVRQRSAAGPARSCFIPPAGPNPDRLSDAGDRVMPGRRCRFRPRRGLRGHCPRCHARRTVSAQPPVLARTGTRRSPSSRQCLHGIPCLTGSFRTRWPSRR